MVLAPQAFCQFNAGFLTCKELPELLERKVFVNQVLIEFADYQTAIDCYHLSAYQRAKQYAGVADVKITFADGLGFQQLTTR